MFVPLATATSVHIDAVSILVVPCDGVPDPSLKFPDSDYVAVSVWCVAVVCTGVGLIFVLCEFDCVEGGEFESSGDLLVTCEAPCVTGCAVLICAYASAIGEIGIGKESAVCVSYWYLWCV